MFSCLHVKSVLCTSLVRNCGELLKDNWIQRDRVRLTKGVSYSGMSLLTKVNWMLYDTSQFHF